jgi:hypothetical protein
MKAPGKVISGMNSKGTIRQAIDPTTNMLKKSIIVVMGRLIAISVMLFI